MEVTRMDLDGAGSPTALVTKILKAEPNLCAPIPIEALAQQLDIRDITEISTDAFEGSLITDVGRSEGFILLNKETKGGRRRFTIGHELGHFLLTHHKPSADNGFQCSRADMRRWTRKSDNPLIRMEAEANEFSALMLMPPPLWRKEVSKCQDPNIEQILKLADTFDVSKEAAARTYAEYHDGLVATAIVKDGKIARLYQNTSRFPRMCVRNGHSVPASSRLFRGNRQPGHLSSIEDARPEHWLESEWGSPLPELYEQALFQNNGFALLMLWAEPPEKEDDDDDADGDRTARERLRDRLAQ